jgi:hypothetical protein
MHFLSRREIDRLRFHDDSLQQHGDLPYLLEQDRYRLLSVGEAASIFGFDPSDFRDFFVSYPNRIPSLCLPAGICFDRTALCRWYVQTALPLLQESNKN